MAATPTTTRAYTLKLGGHGNEDWRDALWTTHLTVNRGVQAWGDWLLTLRGGLPASLADGHPERQVVLALSWLSVESPAELAPQEFLVADGTQSSEERAEAVRACFVRVLQQKGVSEDQHANWLANCEAALEAAIRPDAVWVNRAGVFAECSSQYGIPSDSETIWDLAGRFFSSLNAYFELPKLDSSQGGLGDEPEMVKQALGWLSNRFGDDDAGADFEALSQSYKRIEDGLHCVDPGSGDAVLRQLSASLGVAPNLNAVLKTVSATGHKSATRNLLKELHAQPRVSEGDIARLKEIASEDAAKALESVGRKGHREWADQILQDIEDRSGMPYANGTKSPNRSEYSVMLDHAARRFRLAHTWMKRAEAQRRAFDVAREELSNVPEDARNWLDQFCVDRTQVSAAADAYLIRKRAIDGWAELVQRWSQSGCVTEQDRIDAARELQSDPEIEKFGDIQLFEALAADEAACVWNANRRPDKDILRRYVEARQAEHDQRRFKVPAYRHPDALRHPVFVDFGNSRWSIDYAALAAAREREKLLAQLEKADTDIKRRNVQLKLAATPDLHAVTLGLWTGEGIESVPLKWHCRRLRNSLDLNHFDKIGPTVSRADRFGRAIADAASAAVSVAEVFQQKDWNGRLQAPRRELDQLADYLARQGLPLDDRTQWDERARKLWDRLGWLLSFSARLKPQGPWLDFVEQGLPDGVSYRKGRTGYFLAQEANKTQKRKSRSYLQLQRLPGLRVVSIDLGHRVAASCAVWETVSAADFDKRRREADDAFVRRDGELGGADLFCHLRFPTGRLSKQGEPLFRIEVYRRIGPDQLSDGVPHPAPWARLDRQFLIKLQGEDRPVRAATADEAQRVAGFRSWLGLPNEESPFLSSLRANEVEDQLAAAFDGDVSTSAGTQKKPRLPRVDELMADSVRLAQLGIRRLGLLARIANSVTATERPGMGGVVLPLSDAERIELLQGQLASWFDLAHSSRYQDAVLRSLWYEHIAPLLDGEELTPVDENATRPEQKKQRESLKVRMRRAAETLAGRDNADLFELLKAEWQQRAETWQKQHLRWLRDWLMPRGGKSQAKNKALRHVGGLSLQRIQTLRSLYRVMKSFHQKPTPDDLLAGKKLVEEDAAKGRRFGQRMLDAFEQLRENRIKQLASRIVEAALGIGSENRAHWDGHKRARQQIKSQNVAEATRRRFKPCHAVVIENLERYRPDETQTRRENRQLMDWSARNVRKFLMEGCELNGLYFAEVAPQYTSRQDSRTGAPGVRATELPRRVLAEAASLWLRTPCGQPLDVETASEKCQRSVRFWKGEIERAEKRLARKEKSPRDQYLVDLARKAHAEPGGQHATVCIPRRGGELFLSAEPATDWHSGILQADLNAAANIGLRALMDPDWPGAWWYVPAQLQDGRYVPAEKKVTGLPKKLFDGWALGQEGKGFSIDAPAMTSATAQKNPNLWRDVSDLPLTDGEWLHRKVYEPQVEARVLKRLRKLAGLDG